MSGPTCNGRMPVRSEYADDEDFRELLEAFVETIAEKQQSMRALCRDGSIDELGRQAHQLKGAAGGYGFPDLSAAAALLEDACRENDTVRVAQSLSGALDLLDRIQV